MSDQGVVLLAIARDAIAAQLGLNGKSTRQESDWLTEPGACFVTLHKNGNLRGCIGSLLAHRPLGRDVAANACAAAFQDPRFPPLTSDEFAQVNIEVSVLSKPVPIFPASEAELLAMLRPGVDGLILEYGAHRSTFLPQVWEQLPDPAQFLAHLKQKGGLPVDFWHADMRISRYSVTAYAEKPGEKPEEAS